MNRHREECVLFLAVSYHKCGLNKQHILDEASLYILKDYKVMDKHFQNYPDRTELKMCQDGYESTSSQNRYKIETLDKELTAYINNYALKKAYVYGDNQIFHRLQSLRALAVTDINTRETIDVTTKFNVKRAQEMAYGRNASQYPANRGTMSSIVNLCGLIVKNYKNRYSAVDKKLYPCSGVRRLARGLNKINILRYKLYACVDILQKKYGLSLSQTEKYLQCVLLNMFYPYKFKYFTEPRPNIYIEGITPTEWDKEIDSEIIILPTMVRSISFVNHAPYGGLTLSLLNLLTETQFTG